jgi:Leucine-rich repeat (LRR) protein
MCRVYLIILLFGLFVVGDSSVDGSYCKTNGSRIIQSQTVYNIENCTNTEIELGNYYERTSLVIVKAFNNQISQISDDTFKSATGLTIIDLRENKIEEISVGAFKDQGKLQHLYLKQNKLTRIEVGTFDSLTELKDLWLMNNQLSLIEKGLFDKNRNLRNLFMDENKIIAIESTVFEKLNSIQSLTLDKNLCVNQSFNSNKFDQNFSCFKSYEFLKTNLDEILQLKSEKLNCLTEKDSSNKALIQKINELYEIKNNLSTCQRDNETIYHQKDQLAEKLQNYASRKSRKSIITSSNFLIISGIIGLDLIAFLISIVKICQLSKENRGLKAKRN